MEDSNSKSSSSSSDIDIYIPSSDTVNDLDSKLKSLINLNNFESYLTLSEYYMYLFNNGLLFHSYPLLKFYISGNKNDTTRKLLIHINDVVNTVKYIDIIILDFCKKNEELDRLVKKKKIMDRLFKLAQDIFIGQIFQFIYTFFTEHNNVDLIIQMSIAVFIWFVPIIYKIIYNTINNKINDLNDILDDLDKRCKSLSDRHKYDNLFRDYIKHKFYIYLIKYKYKCTHMLSFVLNDEIVKNDIEINKSVKFKKLKERYDQMNTLIQTKDHKDEL